MLADTISQKLAWCAQHTNHINIINIATHESYISFDGSKISDTRIAF